LKRLLIWLGLISPPASPQTTFPPITPWMKDKGLTWAKVKDKNDFVMVCDFCGGNCGQCGMTSIIGNVPFDMQFMVDNLMRQG
jgi:hypothetical protein